MFSQVDVPLTSSVSTYSGFPCFVCISLSGVVYAMPCAFISVLNAPKLLNTTEHFSLLESRPLNSNSCTAKSKLGVSKSFSSVPYQSVALFNKTLAVQPPTVIVGNGFVSVGVILILCCLNVGFPWKFSLNCPTPVLSLHSKSQNLSFLICPNFLLLFFNLYFLLISGKYNVPPTQSL